ncbi:TolC family protein, partial [Aquimarina celericrescens]|nr:TolC family protein [Aquimarina celericrescens]
EYDVPVPDIMSKTPEQIIEKSKQERYEVQVAKQQVELAGKDVEITRSEFYPSLNGFVNYNTRETDRARGAGLGPLG